MICLFWRYKNHIPLYQNSHFRLNITTHKIIISIFRRKVTRQPFEICLNLDLFLFCYSLLHFYRYVLKKIRLSKQTEKFKRTAHQEVTMLITLFRCFWLQIAMLTAQILNYAISSIAMFRVFWTKELGFKSLHSHL